MEGKIMNIDRRDFLKLGTIAAAKVILDKSEALAIPAQSKMKGHSDMQIPKRKLGKTGRQLSTIGLGGMVIAATEQENANKIVAEAFEAGINYFDVAPSYQNAQERLGPALKPYRDKVFLACKSEKRDKAGLAAELSESLRQLQTDHFDLYQLHAIRNVERDVHAVLAKGGAMEAILEAKKQGKVKYIGFSAHTPEAALAAMREFDFDTILYPINFACHFRNEFDTEVIAEAQKRGMGILALKAMARGPWPANAEKKYAKCWYEPIDDPHLAKLALTWTLSQPVTAAIPPGEEKLFKMALSFVPQITALTESQLAELEKAANAQPAVFPEPAVT
jgi:aryl-alcohol dehydrogenase-like predicted oxidoreductase